jgi:hypothetical protein
LGFAGSFFERQGDTLVPTSGSANYTGDYVAWIADDGTYFGRFLITGDASMDVDFESASIEGTITNRVDHFNASNTLGDVEFETTSIVDGGFAGTTSGGAFDTAGATASAGEYGGLLTGSDGQEVVGGVQILHENAGSLIETGAFIAE